MGHEYGGVLQQIGADVKNVKPGDIVVGSFSASGNTCEICQVGHLSLSAEAKRGRSFTRAEATG
jgi:Zn-dependent alcohol dehydrogenase